MKGLGLMAWCSADLGRMSHYLVGALSFIPLLLRVISHLSMRLFGIICMGSGLIIVIALLIPWIRHHNPV
jgi:F0F1-type ATP synthase membrane subunit a